MILLIQRIINRLCGLKYKDFKSEFLFMMI